MTKQSLWRVLQQSAPVFSTAFGTSSSVATLPVAMIAADALKSKPFVTRLMLPICASINVGIFGNMCGVIVISHWMTRKEAALAKQSEDFH